MPLAQRDDPLSPLVEPLFQLARLDRIFAQLPGRAHAGQEARRMPPAIASRRRIRSSRGGCVLKRPDRVCPPSGFTKQRWANAGWADWEGMTCVARSMLRWGDGSAS